MIQVTLNSVNKTFGKTHVIRNVDLEIEKGEFVVFVGLSNGILSRSSLFLFSFLSFLHVRRFFSVFLLVWFSYTSLPLFVYPFFRGFLMRIHRVFPFLCLFSRPSDTSSPT